MFLNIFGVHLSLRRPDPRQGNASGRGCQSEIIVQTRRITTHWIEVAARAHGRARGELWRVIDPPGDPARLVDSPAADSATATDVKLTIKLSILGLGDTRSVSTDIVGYQRVQPNS